MEKVKVEMCSHYTWNRGPRCDMDRRPSIRCHAERLDCPDYEPSWGYASQVPAEKGENT